jgi:ferredoxin
MAKISRMPSWLVSYCIKCYCLDQWVLLRVGECRELMPNFLSPLQYIQMSKQSSNISLSDFKLSTIFGSLGCGSCASSCCEEALPTPEEIKQIAEDHALAARMKNISLIMRVMRAETDSILMKAIRQILDETGELPEINVIPEGTVIPPQTKRQLTIRIADVVPEIPVLERQ